MAAGGRGGGGSGCPTPPAGSRCGCGAQLDCAGVCQVAGTCSALLFEGNAGAVTVGATTQVVMNQSATIEAWVQLHSRSEHGPIFRKVRGNAEDKSLAIEAGYVWFYFYRGGTLVEIRSRTLVPLNAWTHVAGVYDGSNIRIYLNGERTDSAAVEGVRTISNSDGEIFIGLPHTMYEVSFDGVISDVRVSSSARYMADFTPPALHSVDSATLALWRLDEGTGAVAADLGPAHLNASIVRASAAGSPRWVAASPRR